MPSSDNFIGGISTSFLSCLLNATTELLVLPPKDFEESLEGFLFTGFLLTVCALLLMQHVITRRLMRISQFSLKYKKTEESHCD